MSKSVVSDSAETRECWNYNAENCISISALVAEILRSEVFLVVAMETIE